MMKNKRIKSLLLALCLCLACSTSVFAKESEGVEFDLPEDAIVLYQDDNAILYQSKSISTEQSKDTATTYAATDYESVWLNSSASGYFNIYNHHPGRTGVTWKVESSSDDSRAIIYMTAPSGATVLSSVTVRPSDGDVYFRLSNGVTGTYQVHYIATTSVGMRIMCWMYD